MWEVWTGPSLLLSPPPQQDCSLIVYQPYRPLQEYCDSLAQSKRLEQKKLEEVTQKAWSVVNDSLRTNACLVHPPFMIALGVWMAAWQE